MVRIINPKEELIKRSEERAKQINKLTELTSSGYVSKRLGSYAKELVVLYQLSDEVETYIGAGKVNLALDGLTEMKCKLDNVASVLLADGEIKSKLADGILCLANPNFENLTRHKELYDFAQEIYTQSQNKLNTLFQI